MGPNGKKQKFSSLLPVDVVRKNVTACIPNAKVQQVSNPPGPPLNYAISENAFPYKTVPGEGVKMYVMWSPMLGKEVQRGNMRFAEAEDRLKRLVHNGVHLHELRKFLKGQDIPE